MAASDLRTVASSSMPGGSRDAGSPAPLTGSDGHHGGQDSARPTDLLVMVRAVLRAMRVTFQNLLRKPVTVHYPDVERPYPDRYRGLLALVYDKHGEEACIGCRLCEYVCPPAVIKVEMLKAEKRNYAKTFTLELYACEFCELCVQVCPTDAIVMLKSFDLSTSDRRELLLDKDRLHALGLQHQPSWATGTQLRTMQAPPKPPPPPPRPKTTVQTEGARSETATSRDEPAKPTGTVAGRSHPPAAGGDSREAIPAVAGDDHGGRGRNRE